MSAEHKQKVIAIVGPTASGKTSLAIYLAQKVHGEVISADSRQVYTGLNIGTGKVTKKEMASVPHHLLDVLSPKRIFSASDFERLGKAAIEDITTRGTVPIIAGGTGLYVDTLLGRMVLPDVPPNDVLRKKLEGKSAPELFLLLQKKDPRRATTIEKHNPRRLVRALEIATAIGQSPEATQEDRYDVLWLGLCPPEKTLHKHIKVRLDARMKQGMLAEAKKLHKGGLSYKRMRELGLEYGFLADLLENKITKQEFLERLEKAIQHYAKRQMRWFKRNEHIHWIKNKTEATRLVKAFLK